MSTTPQTRLKEEFERVALPHMQALYRTARRLCGNEKDAEDLVQDTFLRAYTAFHQFQPGTNIKAWLFKIMNNLHINRFHQQMRRPQTQSYDEMEEFSLYSKLAGDGLKLTEGSPDREFLERLVDEEVKLALESLPHDFLMAVLLCDIERFSYQEMAHVLGCPVGTVRSRIFRGRRLLEKKLWDYAVKADYAKERS